MTFPLVRLDIVVEFFIDGAYVNVTNLRPTYNCYIFTPGDGSANSQPAIKHKLVRKSNQRVVTRSVSFSFYDPNGIMNNENANSPYYQKIPRGTRVRVTINSDVGLRYFVAIDSVAPNFDNAPRSVTVDFVCTGQYDQRAFGDKPLASPINRSVTRDTTVRDFWPLEESQGANQFTPATRNTIPSVPIGTLTYAGYTDLGGAAQTIKLNADSYLRFRVRSGTTFNNQWQIDWFTRFIGPRAGTTLVFRLYTTGTVVRWEYTLTATTQQLIGYAPDNSIVVNSGVFGLVGFQTAGWSHVRLMAQQSGGNVNWQYVFFPVPIASGSFFGSSYAGSVGRPIELQFPPSANMVDVGLSSVAVFDNYNYSVVDASGGGFVGEQADDRFFRLCNEEGISSFFNGNLSDGAPMGIQPRLALMEILRQCVETDGGYMIDSRGAYALTMIMRNELYTKSPEFTLSYSSSHLADGLSAVIGGVLDTTIVNDMVASKTNGGSARYIIPDGDYLHWSTEAPPAGVGIRDGSINVNPQMDSVLNEQAAWGAHLASWREARFETVTVDQARPAVANNATLLRQLRITIPTDAFYIDITGAGPWLPPDQIRLIIEGREDDFSQFGATTRFNTTQADKFEVDLVNTSGSTLLFDVTNSATSWKVRTSLGPEWSLTDTPYHWIVDGEAVRVTAVTTDTPTFVAAGTVSIANNASVVPGLPAGMVDGDLMVMQASTRGAGVPVVPAGWSRVAGVLATNMYIMVRHYVTGDVAPTVSFTGGAAGDDTLGRIAAFRNLTSAFGGSWLAGSSGKETPDYQQVLNGVTANIAYSKLYVFRKNNVVMLFAWKQDDWTPGAGVTPPAGFTEAWEDTTTTGNDASQTAQYQIQTAATDVPAGSLVIAGGAAAISRAVAVAFRPTQTATVQRSKNNIVVAHTAGAAIRSWRPGLVGL